MPQLTEDTSATTRLVPAIGADAKVVFKRGLEANSNGLEMAKKDIHKIDNWLIRMGWLCVASLLFTKGCTDTFADLAALDLILSPMFAMVAVGATALLVVGYSIRARENKVLVVWDILEHATEVSIADLGNSTGFSSEFLSSAIRTINQQPGCYYVWDGAAGVIVDGRMRSRVVVVGECESCGANINSHVSLDLPTAPACEHCGGPVVTGDLNRLKLERVDALRTQESTKQEFSVLLFVFLLIVFWPAAVAYAVWASGAVDNLFKRG
jgi:hypothetical protein